MKKACVLTIDMVKEKLIGIDFFEGNNCCEKSEAFSQSMKKDWPFPRYRTICHQSRAAKKEAMEKRGIIGLFKDEEND